MGTDEFLSCLSRPALEGACANTSVLPRQKVKDTRAALVEHFQEGHFVHASALFAPDETKLTAWLKKHEAKEEAEDDGTPTDQDVLGGAAVVEPAHDHDGVPPQGDAYAEGFREAAE